MTMSDYGSSPIVSNVGELVSKVATIVGSTNMKHWFRGHHSADWSLEPSIHRIKENPELIGVTERDFMHTFRSRAGVRYKDTPEFDDIAGWISLMQHYGLPTRLLDWSRSPLIAAYFALERYLYDRELDPIPASIWMLQPHALNESQGLGDYTLTISSGECKNDIAPAFYHSAEEQVFVRAVMASESDLRMFVQQGAFTIHPTNMALDKMQLSVEILRKFIIPAECCYKMAAELAVAGFRRGDIYPDLQNLSDDLRSFAPRLFR